MATLATITARVLSMLGSDAKLTTAEAESLAQTRYEHEYEVYRYSRRLRDFTISLVATVDSTSSDTVTVANGSANVTSAGTPFTSAMTNRQMRIDGQLQPFGITFSSSSLVTLHDGEGTTVTWPGTGDSGLSWTIQQSLYSLPATADAVVSLAWEIPLTEIDGGRGTLDNWDPYRSYTGDPTHWCYAGVDGSNAREIEVWPVPTTARLLRGQMTRMAPTLAAGTTIDMPVPILVFGTAADACHLLHSKQGSTETMWEAKALFFERKLTEVRADYRPIEADRLSLPTSIGRRLGRGPVGGDYYVSHQPLGEFP